MKRLLRNPKIVSMGAALLGQLFMFAAMAVVSRYYAPEHLTEYGIFFSLFAVLQVTVTLRLEQGLVYEKTGQDVADLASAAFLLLPFGVTLAVAGCYVYLVQNPDTQERAGMIALVLAGSALFAAAARVVIHLIARSDRFFTLAFINLLRPGTIAAGQLMVLLLVGIGYGHLTFAFMLSQLVLLGLVALLWYGDGAPPLPKATRRGMRAALSRNRAFIFYSLPQNVLFALSEALVPLSLSFIFPEQDNAVALFWLASRAVFAPAQVMAESIRHMVYRTIAQRREGRLAGYVLKTSLALALPMAVGVGVLLLCGEQLFELVFGAGWGAANPYAVILAALALVNMAVLPFVGALPVLNIQRSYLVVEIVGLLARAGCLFLLVWETPVEALRWATAAYMIVMLLFMAWIVQLLHNRDRGIRA